MSEYFLFTDGACKGNPGKAGGGAVLYDANMKEIECECQNFGITTNNVSEYKALIMGIEMCLRRGIRIDQLNIRADSMLAVNHVNGVWKCRDEKLVPLFMKVKKFGTPKSVQHVYRTHNKRADELANQGVLL